MFRIRYIFSAGLLSVLLSACGSATASTSPTAPPLQTSAPAIENDRPNAEPASLPTNAPTAVPTLLPTDAPTAAPTSVPTAAPAATSAPGSTPPEMRALYACKLGLCLATLDNTAPEVLLSGDPLDLQLSGYAFMPDGSILFGRKAEIDAAGAATIFLADRQFQNPQPLFHVRGAESGLGELEGYGVHGATADGQQIIFEDQAQLYIADLDGQNRHALMDTNPYGASSIHSYSLSPSGRRALLTGSGLMSYFEVADADASQVFTFTLPLDHRAVALVDDTHVLVERFDPPFEEGSGNPAAVERYSLGYEVTSIEGGQLGNSTVLRSDDGSFSRTIISNVVGDWLMVSDVGQRANDGQDWQPKQWLLNIKTGVKYPITLPEYDGYGVVALMVAP